MHPEIKHDLLGYVEVVGDLPKVDRLDLAPLGQLGQLVGGDQPLGGDPSHETSSIVYQRPRGARRGITAVAPAPSRPSGLFC